MRLARCLAVCLALAVVASTEVVELLEEDVAGGPVVPWSKQGVDEIPFTPLSKVKALGKVKANGAKRPPAPSKRAKATAAAKKNEKEKAKSKAVEAKTAKKIKKKGQKYKKIADTLMGKKPGKTGEKTASKAAHESVMLEALKEARKECNALLKDAKNKCWDMVTGMKNNTKTSKIMSHAAADIKHQQKKVKAQMKANGATAKQVASQTGTPSNNFPTAPKHDAQAHVQDKLGPAPSSKMPPASDRNTHVEDKLGPNSPYELGNSGVYKGPKSPLCDKLFVSVTNKCNALLRVAQPDTRDHFDSAKIQQIFAMYKRYQKEANANIAKITPSAKTGHGGYLPKAGPKH